MKVGMSGEDYIVHLSFKAGELEKLKLQSLETNLTDADTGKDLRKRVVMEIRASDIPDGIEVNYFPEKRKGWKDVREIRITITAEACERIKQNRHTCTRYNGSDMIDIFDK